MIKIFEVKKVKMESLSQTENIGELILEVLNRLPKDSKINVAFLGYTDLMLNTEQWSELGVSESDLENRSNFQKLITVHGRSDVTIVPTLSSALEALGQNVKLTVFDFEKVEGTEIEWDFHFTIDTKYEQKFDVVFDFGTCEHIFNLAQAFTNIHKMLNIDGFVYHGGPLCWPNHGFYGYNPTLFCDFYEDNCGEIVELYLSTYLPSGQNFIVRNLPKYDRFRMRDVLQQKPEWLGLEFNLCVLVKKINHCQNITFPIQKRYRDMSKWV